MANPIKKVERFAKTNKKLVQSLYHYALLLMVAGVFALALYSHPANGQALYSSVPMEIVKRTQLPKVGEAVLVSAKSSPTQGSSNEPRIREIAKELGLTKEQENRAVRIGYCESGLRTSALGDGGKSRGIWQIYKPAHPSITDQQAYDLEWSTRWALQRMKDGYWRLWTCNRLI